MMFVKKPSVDDPDWQASLKLPPALDAEWTSLIDAAKVARQRSINDFAAGVKPEVNSALYGRYKQFLLKLFNNKCAYCETLFTAAQPGDVEHFRPKGRVVDENFKPILVKYQNREIEHPGYYWLAYDWKNLLPSCIDCNRFRHYGERVPGATRADSGAGKADRFPLKLGSDHVVVPDDEVRETPLLIDPTRVDPSGHFEFMSNGIMKPKTEEAEITLRVIGLNRADLVEQREQAFGNAEAMFAKYVNSVMAQNPANERYAAKRVNQMYACKESYSAIQRLAIDNLVAYWAQRRIIFNFPLDEKAGLTG